jgi:FixJ family two-component response regulator
MTGSLDPALRKGAMEIGCLDFLEKPFDISRLVAAINKIGDAD